MNDDSYTSRIFRSQHDKSNPYVQINKKAIRYDKKLTLEATGLLSYLLCLPDNWEINIREVARHKMNGEKVFYRVFRELIAAGYIKRYDVYGPNKRGSGRIRRRCDYEVGELPYFNPERMKELEKEFEANLGVSQNSIPDHPPSFVNEKPKNFRHAEKGHVKAIQNLNKSSTDRKAAAPSFKKSEKINILDFSHPIWGKDKKTYEEVKNLYIQRSSTKLIKSTEGWIRECLKKGWHLEDVNRLEKENSPQRALNAKFSREVEKRYKRLPSHPMCDISALKDRISIIWGSEPIKTPTYHLEHALFKETVVEILKKKGVWEELCRV